MPPIVYTQLPSRMARLRERPVYCPCVSSSTCSGLHLVLRSGSGIMRRGRQLRRRTGWQGTARLHQLRCYPVLLGMTVTAGTLNPDCWLAASRRKWAVSILLIRMPNHVRMHRKLCQLPTYQPNFAVRPEQERFVFHMWQQAGFRIKHAQIVVTSVRIPDLDGRRSLLVRTYLSLVCSLPTEG